MAAMGDDPAPPEKDEPHGTDLWIAPFFRDSTLWTVLVTGAAGAFTIARRVGDPCVAFVERNPFGGGRACSLLLWITVDAGHPLTAAARGGRFLLAAASPPFWTLSIGGSRSACVWLGWFLSRVMP